jgi:polar amino acid transport system substrate-binding protein
MMKMFLRPAKPAFLFSLLLSVGMSLAAALARADGATCTQLIASGNPEYPPYLWRDPADDTRLIGAAAELMQKLSTEIGLPISVRYAGPWGRVQDEVRQGHVDLIAGAFYTLPRLEYMDYFQPPLHSTRSVVFSQGARKFDYRKWSDLAGRKGLTVINNSFGEAFDRYAEKNLSIDKVSTLESAIGMLSLGRADYLIYEQAPGEAFAAKLGIKGLHVAPVPISSEDLYLTLSYNSPCNTGALRGRIAQAMYKFAKDRTMDKLVAEAIKKWGS